MRKIIQIQAQNVSCGESGFDQVHALCDDGTVWCMNSYCDWHLLPPIPQGEISTQEMMDAEERG